MECKKKDVLKGKICGSAYRIVFEIKFEELQLTTKLELFLQST